ncbi:putative odorant receptor 71a [Colletes latitarsis]|uniref:putative odorant receptor 71a n=1 Tax=Colletes latitarsis TaxID=2605962 RepID=UPI00403734A8
MRNVVINSENYVKLIDSLQEQPLAPMSIEETMIRKKFDKQAQWNVDVYTTSLTVLVACMIPASLVKDFQTRELSYPLWLPYDYSSSPIFTITCVYQAINFTVCSYLNVNCDSLFTGLLIHVTSQLEILRHRLKHIKRNGDYTAEHCDRLHNRIYKFAAMINEQFKTTLFVQFAVSTSSLCIELYHLGQADLDSDYIVTSLEIPDMIMESDWTSLDTGSRRTFLIIMNRATMPIEFTSAHVATMNLDSFMAIIKTSYSVYNVLLQGQA